MQLAPLTLSLSWSLMNLNDCVYIIMSLIRVDVIHMPSLGIIFHQKKKKV